jgi:hypothetical protein
VVHTQLAKRAQLAQVRRRRHQLVVVQEKHLQAGQLGDGGGNNLQWR